MDEKVIKWKIKFKKNIYIIKFFFLFFAFIFQLIYLKFIYFITLVI